MRGVGAAAPLAAAWCAVVCVAVSTAGAQSASAPGGRRQLVLPFENTTRESRVYWLGEGSAVLLTDDLIALGAQAITREERLVAFDRLRVPPVATLSYATVIRLAQVVGATEVIVGTLELNGNQLRVRARVITLDVGRMLAEIVEEGPLTDIFGIYARIARRLVPDSRVSLDEMEQSHPPLAAFEQYVKGELAQDPKARAMFLREALRLFPRFERARLALWQMHTDLGEHRQALDIARQVAAGHPAYRRAQFLAAVSQIHLQQYQQAFEELSALNRAKSDPALLNAMGVAQLRRQVTPPGGTASYYFAEAAEADSTDSDYFFNLGYASWLNRNTEAAIHWLRETVRRNPADDAAHYVLGVALQTAGSGAEAAREKELARQLSSTYAEWESTQPGSNTAPRGLERLKIELDVAGLPRVESAIAAGEQRDQRTLAAFHLANGRRFFAQDRDADAIAELRRAIFLSPYESEAHLLLGRSYLRSGRIAEAIDTLKISIWSEDTVAAHVALAEAQFQARDFDAARAQLQIVAKRDPENPDARRLLEKIPPR